MEIPGAFENLEGKCLTWAVEVDGQAGQGITCEDWLSEALEPWDAGMACDVSVIVCPAAHIDPPYFW